MKAGNTAQPAPVYNDKADEVVVFAVNKDLDEDMALSVELRQFGDYRVIEQVAMTCDDLYAVNTEEAPDRVVPMQRSDAAVRQGRLEAVLEKTSWNMIRLGR